MQVNKQVNDFRLDDFFILCETTAFVDALDRDLETLYVFDKLKLLLLTKF